MEWLFGGKRLLAGGEELVFGSPGVGVWGDTGLPAEIHAESGEPRVAGEVHFVGVVVEGCVIAVGGVIVIPGEAPGRIVALIQRALLDGAGRDTAAGKREVVGAVI